MHYITDRHYVIRVSEANFWCNYLSHVEYLLISATEKDIIVSKSEFNSKEFSSSLNDADSIVVNKEVYVPQIDKSDSTLKNQDELHFLSLKSEKTNPGAYSDKISFVTDTKNYFFSNFVINQNGEYLIPLKTNNFNKIKIGFYGVKDINELDYESCICCTLFDGLEKFAVYRKDEDMGKRISLKFDIKKSFTSVSFFKLYN